MKKFGLGKGLGSLIPPRPSFEKSVLPQSSPVAQGVNDRVWQVSIEKIIPNPHQPRKNFFQGGIEELSLSIAKHGILQPLIAMKIGDTYQLIAGERRLRAAKLAGMKAVPVIVRDAERQEQIELSLIENIQRRDLNPIEEAIAYQRLIDEFHMTQEELGRRLGKSRPFIANILRLLTLDAEIQKALMEGKISYSAARIIAGLPEHEQKNFFYKILKSGFTVNDVENEAKKIVVRKHTRRFKDAKFQALEEMLRHALGTKVTIKKSGATGQIIIQFYSNEELDGLIKRING